VKLTPLLEVPFAVTTMLPVAAPVGTVARIDVGLQPVAVAATPPNVTVLLPWICPKFVPVIVTNEPTGPEVCDNPLMLGPVPGTVNATPLLVFAPTTTITFPVVAPDGTGTLIDVALQLVGIPETPLKFTVLLPCDDPKFLPVIVVAVPTAPEVGEMLVMLGAAVPTSNP
jgi:hypothetical protein